MQGQNSWPKCAFYRILCKIVKHVIKTHYFCRSVFLAEAKILLSRARITVGESRDTQKNCMRAVCAGNTSTYKWYARGMREAFARLVHTSREISPVGFGGCRLGLYSGARGRPPRNPQGNLRDPFRESPRDPFSPLSPGVNIFTLPERIFALRILKY